MKLFSRIITIYEDRAKTETLIRLRSLSNRQLKDCGISAELLREGIKAWPWKELPSSVEPLRFVSDKKTAMSTHTTADLTAAKDNRLSIQDAA